MDYTMTAFYVRFGGESFAAFSNDFKNPPGISNRVLTWQNLLIDVSKIARARQVT